MKYLFLLLIISVGCTEVKQENCSLDGWEQISLRDSVLISIPDELFAKKDTQNYDFEVNDDLLTLTHFTNDSLSSIHINAKDYRNKYLSKADAIKYSMELQQHYKSIFGFRDTSYSFQQTDTTSYEVLSEFYFLTKKGTADIAFGGMILFNKNIRYDIFVTLHKNNFKDLKETMGCIFSSVTIK